MTSAAISLLYAWIFLPLLTTGRGQLANPHGPCIFPFNYNGKIYSSCTTDGSSDGKLWCSLTRNFDEYPKWTYCEPSEYEGNSKGKPCVFPFIYRNRTFYTCTNEATKDGRFWSATTGNYDEDRQWRYCADSRLDAKPKGPCVFPFIYKGKSQSSCIMEEAFDGKLWCSLTSNYDVDPKMTYCDLGM
ncbi:matrix metalloproteinase-9-like [Sceloporus undulatus]|uniref:matrix metalloproteinase-9-like n=1 Tax=Sceloporus undulatus TaxID=8520 RepID=UPI001C4AD2FC|nr:matrix metalloproteinase-9-like [Sceloporus undulatus]